MAIIGRRKMGKIDLAKLKVGFQGKPFNQLVKHHLKRQNTRQLFGKVRLEPKQCSQHQHSLYVKVSLIDGTNEYTTGNFGIWIPLKFFPIL